MLSYRSVLVVVAGLALAACGGGGGGDSGGSSSGGSSSGGASSGGFTVSTDRTSVSFDYIQGTFPAPQIVTATWTGTPPASLHVGAVLQGTGLSPTIPLTITSTVATALLLPATGLTAGTYSGVVQFLVCSDSACTQRVGGSPIPISYTINVRAPIFSGGPDIQLDYVRWVSTASPTATINVNASSGAWTANASHPWLTLSQTSGSGAAAVTVGVNPAGLTAGGGLLLGSVTFTAQGVSQTTAVRVNVTEPTIQLPSVMLSGTNGAAIAPQSVSVSVQGAGSATLPMQVSSSVPWLTVNSASPSISGSASGVVSLGLNPSVGPLASGTHTGTLRFRLGTAFDTLTRDVTATFALSKAILTATPASVVLGGSAGHTFDDVPLTIALDTGGNAYPWTATVGAAWFSVDDTTGTVSSSGQDLILTPDRLQTTVGTATSSLSFSVPINGDVVTLQVPVSFNLDTHRLIAADNGVALADVPGSAWDVPGQAVEIRDNLGLDTPWTAIADQPWLAVTPAGNSGDDLVLSASSAGLAVDQLYLATVTVSSTDTTVVGPERIRVGFWVGSAAPAAPQVFNAFSSPFLFATADPIRPHVYVYEYAANSTSIRVLNVYTGAELPPITGLPGQEVSAILAQMFASSDGSRLYIANNRDRSLIPIDLDARTMGTAIVSPQQFGSGIDHYKYIRPNGIGVLLNNIGDAFLESSGAVLDRGLFGYFGVSGNSAYAFFGNTRYTLDYTDVGGGVFSRTVSGSIPSFPSGGDSAEESNTDGSRVYSMRNVSFSDLAGNSVVAANGLTTTFLGAVSTGLLYHNLLVAGNGRVLVVAQESSSGAAQLYVHEADGSAVQAPYPFGNLPSSRGSLSVTGDNRFAVVVSLNAAVHAVPLPP